MSCEIYAEIQLLSQRWWHPTDSIYMLMQSDYCHLSIYLGVLKTAVVGRFYSEF